MLVSRLDLHIQVKTSAAVFGSLPKEGGSERIVMFQEGTAFHPARLSTYYTKKQKGEKYC